MNSGEDELVVGGRPYSPPRVTMVETLSPGAFDQKLLAGYKAELAELRSAQRGIELLADKLVAFAGAMVRHPDAVGFVELDRGARRSEDLPGMRWQVDEFPTAGQLQAALDRRRDSRRRAQRLWQSLGEEQRKGLSAPPR